jgi:uncharacterized protein (TIGR01777 family)
MRVLVTGGTGLIGTRLVRSLRERHDEVFVLTRRLQAARDCFGTDCRIVEGDPIKPGPWMDAITDCEAVVNLAGESIFGRRWSPEFTQLLRDSRVKTTEHVVQALARKPLTSDGRPKVLVNASAVGYYGMLGDEEVTEEHSPGSDILARVCVEWEAAAQAAQPLGVRVATIRIGVVMDKEGGALQQMLRPFRMFAGGPVGSGRQWVSWIHAADLVGIFLQALDQSAASGPINGTSPNPVTNKELAKALGRALHRPSFLPTPAFILRVMLGEVATVITTGQRALPKKALALGYTFRFPTLDAALADLLS